MGQRPRPSNCLELELRPFGVRQDQIMALAREHGLTYYDASYLDLALRTGAVLATFDTKLAPAMKSAGGKLLCI